MLRHMMGTIDLIIDHSDVGSDLLPALLPGSKQTLPLRYKSIVHIPYLSY